MLESGATLISIGHRPSLVRYHTRVLQLAPAQAAAASAAAAGGASGGAMGKDSGGGWRLCSAEEFLAGVQRGEAFETVTESV